MTALTSMSVRIPEPALVKSVSIHQGHFNVANAASGTDSRTGVVWISMSVRPNPPVGQVENVSTLMALSNANVCQASV